MNIAAHPFKIIKAFRPVNFFGGGEGYNSIKLQYILTISEVKIRTYFYYLVAQVIIQSQQFRHI